MTNDELDLVARLYRSGLKPQQIQDAVKSLFPGCQPSLNDLYNYLYKLRADERIGDTPMKVLEHFFDKNGFVYHTRENASNDRTEDIFFCHNKSHKMWRAFPEVLLIDTTYKTNMYDWPLVQFVGVTSISKSFCIGHTFIIREKEKNFT
ncbi:protein FAR1-RELATED SEQUENCE 5-like [Bidens hawaiensis]|uniref:protein FAR1-RELATED SEQUENCE 5-like n=1 Tax=Bidens hawaiensis TaxID=980011 RepID=UPI00404972DF